ncbi:MAG: HAD family phosphatase [Clostridia bacterium]|nr:HAD family phosphatase [Clostridia bacterium]
MMIKLIACDMDGTLLTSDKKLPKDLFSVLEQLRERGILFAVASGRQYGSLRRDFEALVPHILFICENGALIMDKDEQIFLDPIDPDDLPRIIAVSRTMQGVYPAICCAGVALMEETAPEHFLTAMQIHYKNTRIVPDLMTACEGVLDACKVCFYSDDAAESASLPVLQNELGDTLSIIHSDYYWVDVMKPGVNKGAALDALYARLHITKDEAMAFGDYLNDYELLKNVTHSYAMANAHPQLKAIAAHIAPSNDEDGVMRVIKEIVL